MCSSSWILSEFYLSQINTVVMKGVNDDEICDFVQMTKEMPISIRFLEFMPFSGDHIVNIVLPTY